MSWPKLSLVVDGTNYKLDPRSDHALVLDFTCPHRGCKDVGVQGSGKRPSADDRAWEADGYSTCCKKHLGLIRAEVNTLFGVREDQAVLQGRCRVYA